MSKLIPNCKILEGYRNWVIANANYLDGIENISKVAIYFTLGKFDRSQLLTELCVTLTKLVSFLNDQIISNVIQEKRPFLAAPNNGIQNMRTVLTVIEHVKVLLELTAKRLFGLSGRSILISILLLSRSYVQFSLLFWERLKLHDIGPLPPLEKRHFSLLSGEQKQRQPAAAVTLKSGRKVNGIFITDTISDAPGVQRQENTEEKTANLSLFGKALNFAKPLSHFALMTYCGNKSWTPWIVALATDLLALRIVSEGHLTALEEAYLEKWKLGLFIYLLRPPFFSKLTSIIYPCLNRLRLLSPSLVYMIMQVLSLITEWQKIYFHVWD